MGKHALIAAIAVTMATASADAQQWIAPRVSTPTSTAAQPVNDPWIRPAAAYQPPGRVYAIDDAFAGQPPIGGGFSTTPVPGSIGTISVGQPNYYQPSYSQPSYSQPSYSQPSYSQPGFIASPSNHAMAGQQAIVQPGFIQPAIDPYAIYAQPAAGASLVTLQSARRRPFAELEGRIGDNPNSLHGNLFLPFFQQADSFWFADLRGQWDDDDAREYNAGVAWRRLYRDVIVGLYGFYDFRETRFDNEFQGATVGAEALDLNWEARLNWYIPEGGSKGIGGPATASLVNNAIVVQNNVERAYYGFDAEVGRLIWRGGGLYDSEVRGFVGGYYFNNNAAGFNSFGGPRVRLEGRLYDLPRLGPGSRLTLGGTVQYDDLRDAQGIASINLRIPFGAGSPAGGAKLSALERRMLSPIRRDDDIVTFTGLSVGEQAVLVGNGMDGAVLANLTEVTAGQDLPTRVVNGTAAGSSVFVVTGNVNSANTAVLMPGQFLGGQFNVRGQNTGQQVTFGTPFTVNATAANAPIQVANNTTVVGLTVTGAAAVSGIVDGGAGVNGATINNNTVTIPTGNAIAINGPITASTISGNVVTGGGGVGIGTGAVGVGTTISGNMASGSLVGYNFGAGVNSGIIVGNMANMNQVGFVVGPMTGGTINGNIAMNSAGAADGDDSAGFVFSTISGGTIISNNASGNASDGFTFAGNITGGSITLNNATGNNTAGRGFGGFNFFNPEDELGAPAAAVSNTAVVSNNTSNTNGFDGFAFGNVSGGTIANNMATGNNTTANGNGAYSFFNVTGGSINANQATSDAVNGFVFFSSVSGAASITNNVATGNGSIAAVMGDGFNFIGASGTSLAGGIIAGNMATGNADDGFEFSQQITGGVVQNNSATANGAVFIPGGGAFSIDDDGAGAGDGFFFADLNGAAAGDVVINLNTAQQNVNDGFEVGATTGAGTVTNNTANNNGGMGFNPAALPGITTGGNTAATNTGGDGTP